MPGSCVLVTQEGSRPLLVEVQALVDTAHVPRTRAVLPCRARTEPACIVTRALRASIRTYS
ncbi:MAG: DNA repair protein RadA [uncultured Caballeronia sp.]|nr:MAG: DNA repair protein RadA [uncultured Caballeronia sp.]